MKKFLLLISAIGSLGGVFAQKNNVESAAIYLRNLEMEDAKKAIDAAALNEETKSDPKMWYYYTAVYDTIYRNPNFINLDKNVVEKFAVSCKKCIDLDTKKRYSDYCNVAVINSGFASYNKALEYYNVKDYQNALKFFGYVLEVIKYDKENFLSKNNITDKSIILTMADMAIKSDNKPEAKKNLQKLIDLDYNDHKIYALMAEIYYSEEKDTTAALKYIDMGRKKFPTEKDLINQELNIYSAQGKQDVLLNKLNETLELDAENTTLLNFRANVYDKFASTTYKISKHDKDTAITLSKKSKNEKIPANKAKLDKAEKAFSIQADSLNKLSKVYVSKAEMDYNKVIEISPDYLDAHYNLGALTNNKTTEVVEKMNSINSNSQADYDKKFAVYKKVKDSILNVALIHFTKALELAEAMPEDSPEKKSEKKNTQSSTLYSMQQVYANLGDEKKTMEMVKRRKEVDSQ